MNLSDIVLSMAIIASFGAHIIGLIYGAIAGLYGIYALGMQSYLRNLFNRQ
jgi:ABC-type dipeptide/oligopeptide/nickel transport system permease subunit